MFSARTWWLLYYLGHDNTYILEGGFNEWVRHGFDVTKVRPKKKKGHFTPKVQYNLTVNIQELKEALKNENIYLIDSRAKERYLGKTESLYTKAGHIPGALNYFWKD